MSGEFEGYTSTLTWGVPVPTDSPLVQVLWGAVAGVRSGTIRAGQLGTGARCPPWLAPETPQMAHPRPPDRPRRSCETADDSQRPLASMPLPGGPRTVAYAAGEPRLPDRHPRVFARKLTPTFGTLGVFEGQVHLSRRDGRATFDPQKGLKGPRACH